MARPRSIFAGGTDYSGVPLEDIRDHFRDWRKNCLDVVEALGRYKNEVETSKEKLSEPIEVLRFVSVLADFFELSSADFDRLIEATESGVKEAHVELVAELAHAAAAKDDYCATFKREFISGPMKDESMRGLLDKIYADAREGVIYMRDLENLKHRLKTFVDVHAPNPPREELVGLRPGAWGFSFNLKEAWQRFRKRRSDRGSK